MAEILKKSQGASVRAYILTIRDLSTCVAIVSGVFYIFDSHPHDERGMPNLEEGKAILAVSDVFQYGMSW